MTKKTKTKMTGGEACGLMHTALRKICDSKATTAMYNVVHLICDARVPLSAWNLLGKLVAEGLNEVEKPTSSVASRILVEAVARLGDVWDEDRARTASDATHQLHAMTSIFSLFSKADFDGMAAFLSDEEGP
jgi:hypothetical protein